MRNKSAEKSKILTAVSSANSTLRAWEVILEHFYHEKEWPLSNILGYFLTYELDTLFKLITDEEVLWAVDSVQKEFFRIHDLILSILTLIWIDVSDPREKVCNKFIFLH